MPDQSPPKRPGPKGPRLGHDNETPAYRIIYGVFGGISDFCEKTKTPLGTAHRWVVSGVIPAHRQTKVIVNARAAGVDIPLELFVPVPKAA